MTVAATTRKAGPYEGNGTTKEFTFPFKVFSAEDLFVAKSSDDGEVQLVYGTDYTVRLNSDQDTTPGGAVVLSSALADGVYLSVISQMSYDQLAIFTNKGGFYPETLNKCYDKLTILVQQLLEELSRSIKVDITDTMSASELKEKLLDAAEQATVIAKQYAEQAIASASSAQASAKKAEDAVEGLEDTEAELEAKLQAEAVTQKATVTAEGTKQTGLVTDEGTKQLASIQEKVDYIEKVAPSKADVETVADSIASVNAVAPHADDLGEIAEHLDEVHVVGQDLQGINASSLDLGNVEDTPDPVTTVVDGYIKKVAEHIDDCVHPVGQCIEDVHTVAASLSPVNKVAEIVSVDYESIFLNGVD